MQSDTDFRDLIDGMLASKKTLAGRASWQVEESSGAQHSHGAMRWLASLLIGSELCGYTITIKSYPNQRSLTFRIILAADRAVFRVDFADDEPHVNSLDAPLDIRASLITGPHYHSWKDNRRFATAKSLPSKLHNARLLPANLRTFENVYRWFCGEVGIIGIDEFGIPSLPSATKLL